MITALIALISLTLGISLGWYAERLLKEVMNVTIVRPETGVVKTDLTKQADPNKSSGVIKARSPKQVASDQSAKFNEDFKL